MSGMFTNGMPNFTASTNDDPIPANAAIPADFNLGAGVAPMTAAINLGALGYGGAPAVIPFAATVAPALPDQQAVPASSVLHYSILLTGNFTLNNPTGTPWNGMELFIYITQDGTGNRTLTRGGSTKFLFPGGAPTLSTAANAVDRIRAVYNATLGQYLCVLDKAFA